MTDKPFVLFAKQIICWRCANKRLTDQYQIKADGHRDRICLVCRDKEAKQ